MPSKDIEQVRAAKRKYQNKESTKRKIREVYGPRYAKRRKAWKYSITVDELAALEAQQFCRACARGFYGPKTAMTSQCIDHDHRTGKVRNTICRRGNIVLGLVQDDPNLLRAIADYL